MKIIWEEGDIFAGRRLQKPDCGITGSMIIGYEVASPTCYSIIALADGLTTPLGSKADVAIYLNHWGLYHPAELCPKQWMRE